MPQMKKKLHLVHVGANLVLGLLKQHDAIFQQVSTARLWNHALRFHF